MAASPVPILAIIGIYVAFYAVFLGATPSGPDNPDLSETTADEEIAGTSFGGLDIIGDILDAIFGFVTFIFSALTFNVEDAPAYVRVPVAIIILSSLIWSVVTLIRGT